MIGDAFSWELFHQLPVVGILRGFNRAQVERVAIAATEGGLCNIEVTLNTADAPALIRMLCPLLGRQINIGAGTVCSLADLEAALSAGANFIVTPTVVREVITECVRRRVPVFPGAMSPTEIQEAIDLGASLVKIFPSEVLGPGYIRALKGPFPDWHLMPTGGVTVESLPLYMKAGAAGFGVGSPLFDKQRVLAGDWNWVQKQARRFREAYSTARVLR